MEPFYPQQIRDLTYRALDPLRTRLLCHYRFLDLALYKLEPVLQDEIRFGATEYGELIIEPKSFLTTFSENRIFSVRQLLHTVIHCVFLHQWTGKSIERALWNLCTDMAVESVILQMVPHELHLDADSRREGVLARIEPAVGAMTAERIMAFLRNSNVSGKEIREWSELFRMDDHPWYTDEHSEKTIIRPVTGTEKEWKALAERVLVDLEAFSKEMGEGAGNMISALRDLTRERYSYSEFLQKFVTRQEAMKLNMDEFDYITYSYGMDIYKDVSLVEPLEYRDDKKLVDLAIVIDTSGSTYGKLVESFLTKTYNILCENETFSRKFCLHLIQADAQVQSDITVHSHEEFVHEIQNFSVKGGGGTDFRPAFKYVDKLVEDGAFRHLKGLIYFTDGYGTFPGKKPAYETAFVYVGQDVNADATPAWATRLMLEESEFDS